jgi:hypothetical protein
MLIILIMTEEKFDKHYFTINYFIKDYKDYKNVVQRYEDSSGESQNLKEPCLRACLSHFIGQDLTGVKKISEHFVTDHKLHRDHLKRCCCSEEVWRTDDEGTKQRVDIWHGVVTHKLTNLSFIIGRVCFNKLFVNADDADTFFKETCKACGEIVAKRSVDRPNFCNQKCIKQHEEEQCCKRNAEYEEAKQKYIESLQSKNKKIVYTHCLECEKPKTCENHQKWPLCYKCNEKKKSLN